jgi:hypothetical protein
MDNLVLATLLFNTTGIVVITVGMALAYCLPGRRSARQWVAVEQPQRAAVAAPVVASHEAAELAQAA